MRVTDELLAAHQHHLGSLTLIPGTRGVFDVTVDGTIIWSKAEVGRQAHPGEVLTALNAHLGL